MAVCLENREEEGGKKLNRARERKREMEKWEGMWKELKRQTKLALPLTAASFLIFALQFVSILFVGHISHRELAGASIAISFVNSVGYSVLMGSSCALDTLCGQSFGAQSYKAVGIHLQRSMAVAALLCIPLSAVTAFSGRILVLLHQVPEISMAAQSFARLMIPSLFAYGLLQPIIKFLQAQKLVVPIMASTGIAALFHCFNCWVFSYRTQLGYRGAALSISLSYWLNLLLLAIYIRFSLSCKATWTGFSMEAFHDLWGFLKLGVPSTLMVCFQNWQFELLLLLSGLLRNPTLQTSVMSISQNISSLAYVIPVGVSGAISTRISNELGAENPRAARLAVSTAALTSIAEGVVVGAAMIGGQKFWGHAYSSEIEVVNAIATMMPWIALSHCIDGFQCVLLGKLRGCGQQKVGAFVCLISYYLIGIPASNVLGFVFHLGVKGLWIGNICAIFVQDLVILTLTILTNWEKQVVKAKQRVQSTVMPLDQDESENPNKWIGNAAYLSNHSMSISIEPTSA